MNDFMKYDFNIEKITFACFIHVGEGSPTHYDRPSHGLAMHMAGEKEYEFADGKKLTVRENDIIYLPKHSTYNVSSIHNGDCYAINFDFDGEISFSPFVIKAKNHSAMEDGFRTASNVWKLKKHGYVMKCKAELYNIIYAMQNEYFSRYFPKAFLQ